jgi:hypothetical protein
MSVPEDGPVPPASDVPSTVQLATLDPADTRRVALTELPSGVLVDGVLSVARHGELLQIPVVPADARQRSGLMWTSKEDTTQSLRSTSHYLDPALA